ncbi:MAG: transporter [Actinobacteria bacterium]|nr:transporter [Actinomycetota bacterium]
MFVLADIGDSVNRAFDTFFEWIPNLLGALVVLIIGYIIAKVVSGIVTKALQRAGVDRTLSAQPAGGLVQRVTSSPAKLLGTIAFWLLFLGAVSIAVSVLNIEALENFIAAVYAYLPNVLAALLIFIVAGAVSAGVAALATRLMGGTALGKIVATAAPVLVMTIATFMILEQLEIAPEIVRITYAALLGAIALGSALAFGLGGRDVARQLLESAYQKGQENKEQLGQDLQQGKERAKQDVEEQRAKLSESGGSQGQSGPGARVVRPGETSA